MKIVPTKIPEVLQIKPQVFNDERGFFFESYNQKKFCQKLGVKIDFVQDNHSYSRSHVLRGLHYQIQQPQGKLVRVISGQIFDVALDIRKSSPSFGQWVGCYISASNQEQVWIPPGFAHGFLVLSQIAEVIYKTTDFYSPQYERTILWNDKDLGITWPIISTPILSAKDRAGQTFKSAEVFS
ncbi:MAG: dTDP-4-dehydrorhamnose 3,5-epimerase [Cyanobacteria bacterium P01_A01_bin.84]